jgi:hypothetical protein
LTGSIKHPATSRTVRHAAALIQQGITRSPAFRIPRIRVTAARRNTGTAVGGSPDGARAATLF